MLACRYLLELSEEETAAALGVRRGTVKSRLLAGARAAARRAGGGRPVTERELRALAAFVDLPDERDLAPAVRARLRGRPPPAAPALVVVAAALAADRRSRSQCRRRARRSCASSTSRAPDRVRRPPARRPDRSARPRRADRARRRRAHRGFRPLASDLLGPPDEVTWDGGLLWYRYGRTRLLVSQFRARERIDLLKKVVERDTTIAPVTVDGQPGCFIPEAGTSSTWLPAARPDQPVACAASALLWEHGPLTLRLEGDLTLAQALRIAGSFR